jgi:hypothetical protein
MWTEYALCVSSSAISSEATDAQAVAFRSKRKVLKLRENRPLSHYRRILENAVCVNLVESSALEPSSGVSSGVQATEASSPLVAAKPPPPVTKKVLPALPQVPERYRSVVLSLCVSDFPVVAAWHRESLFQRATRLLQGGVSRMWSHLLHCQARILAVSRSGCLQRFVCDLLLMNRFTSSSFFFSGSV